MAKKKVDPNADRIVIKIENCIRGCKRTRTIKIEKASSFGIKPDVISDAGVIRRYLQAIRGVQPLPLMIIDGQQYPCVIEASPRSPKLMLQDKGENMRMYLEVGGADVANVWSLPGPHIVLKGRIIPLEWTGPAEDLDPMMNGPIQVAKYLLPREPWRSILAHAGQLPPQHIKAMSLRGRPSPILEMWEVDSRLCGRVKFKYHEELPEIDPLEKMGVIVAEVMKRNKPTGEIKKCERSRDLEIKKCGDLIKRGALVQRRGAFAFEADGDAADRFLQQVIPNLTDWDVRGHDTLYRGKPSAQITTNTKIKMKKDLLEINLTAEVEGRKINVNDLLKNASRGQSKIIFKDGMRAQLTKEWMDRYKALVDFGGITASKIVGGKLIVPRHAASMAVELGEVCGLVNLDSATKELASLAKGNIDIEKLVLPKNINATFREYQQEGYEWMVFLARHGLGGVLADDMGLGKTLQSIAFVLQSAEEEPGVILVVAPRSVVDNWEEECKKFIPHIPVYTHLGLDRTKDGKELPTDGILLTSYNILQRDIRMLSNITYTCAILDEAHIIRNPEAKTTKAAMLIKSKRRMCLSGTPVQNRAEDLWPIFQFLMPGFLGRKKVLKETLQEDGEAIDRLRERVAPFVLRRLKTEVAKELPPKTEIVLHAKMNDDQDTYYRDLLERERVGVLDMLGSKGLDKSRVSILAAITRLRQAACSPELIGGEGVSSSKLDIFLDLVDELVAEGHRALVFSSFTKFLALAQRALDDRGYSYQYLDGRTRNRGAQVNAFQNGEDPLFLISLKAGGVGLNLTAADYVIILDPWWNPAAEEQAADRAYRIGQDKPVMVYRIVTTDSIEERVLRLQSEKRKLVGDLALEGLARALDDGDVKKLFEISSLVGV